MSEYKPTMKNGKLEFVELEPSMTPIPPIPGDLKLDYNTLGEPYVAPTTLEWAIEREQNMQKFARKLIERIAKLTAQVELARIQSRLLGHQDRDDEVERLRGLLRYAIERAETIASWEGVIDCRHVLDEMDLANAKAEIGTDQQLKPTQGDRATRTPPQEGQ